MVEDEDEAGDGVVRKLREEMKEGRREGEKGGLRNGEERRRWKI